MSWMEAPQRKREVSDRLNGKKSKEEVNYRPQRNLEVEESCFECRYYVSTGKSESACEKVAGIVRAEDVCDLFEARAEESAQPSIEIKVRM